MKPNTDKPKTAKAGRRRFRGLEVAQAALLLVLGVAVAMVLYFVIMDIMQATAVPDVQLNPYNSYITTAGVATIALKFGKPGVVTGVTIEGVDTMLIAVCRPGVSGEYSYPFMVYPGKEYNFLCTLQQGQNWKDQMFVHVGFNGRRVTLRWVASW